MQGMKSIVGAGVVLSLLAISSAQAGSDQSEAESEVKMTRAAGAPASADGEVDYHEEGARTSVSAEIEDVPLGEYQFFVGDELKATVLVVAAESGTEGEVKFSNPQEPGKLLLDFDPRGQVVEWRSGGTAVLSAIMTLTGPGSPEDDDSYESQKIHNELDSLGSSEATGTVDLKAKKNKTDCRIRLRGLESGKLYTVTADDTDIGTIRARRNGKGKLDLSTRPRGKKKMLDLDLARAVIEVWDEDDNAVLMTTLNGTPLGGGLRTGGGRIDVGMGNTGADADARGLAELRLRRRGRIDFQVEVKDLDLGFYDLRVDGVVVTTFEVMPRFSGGTRGEVEFSTDLTEASKLLLNFEPAGALIEVVRNGTVYLSVNFPA